MRYSSNCHRQLPPKKSKSTLTEVSAPKNANFNGCLLHYNTIWCYLSTPFGVFYYNYLTNYM